ncbi:hypothetical protein SAMN03159496_04673 [Rhizobium sp. NFR07]|uniref:hypothetical protein n=1 Tax=Rhizobium sp. NFR07 TaxID=1566262 RepID=UPI0008EBF894|nr:hypothetical protein [Rhizobium sp. NFR07]SFB52629.1 hypothetical protein SAMN03159496_04673 [Rhizobium sp. NFR07]
MSTAFQKVLDKEHENDSKLGMPSTSLEHHVRRLTLMERLAGGKGWRDPKKEPRRDAQGLTRGQRKRALRETTNAKVSESRPYLFMHSAARARWRAEQVRAAA